MKLKNVNRYASLFLGLMLVFGLFIPLISAETNNNVMKEYRSAGNVFCYSEELPFVVMAKGTLFGLLTEQEQYFLLQTEIKSQLNFEDHNDNNETQAKVTNYAITNIKSLSFVIGAVNDEFVYKIAYRLAHSTATITFYAGGILQDAKLVLSFEYTGYYNSEKYSVGFGYMFNGKHIEVFCDPETNIVEKLITF